MATNPEVITDTPVGDPPSEPPSNDIPADLPADDPPSDPPADTPSNDDWRESLAGEDKDLAKFLGRFHSQDAAFKKFKEQHDDMRSGKFIKPLPENPTDDELADYRAQVGVPSEAAGYLEKLPDGLVVGDDDKPFVEKFVENMHGANAPQSSVSAALDAYYKIVEDQEASESEAANEAKNASIEALRDEWGPDYKRNLNIMNSHLETMPEAVKEVFTHGRMPDGTPVGFNAEVLKWVTGQAMEVNPVATVVPGAGSNQAGAISDELATLEKMMGDRNSDYWKGSNATKNQARYVELVEANEKLKSQQ